MDVLENGSHGEVRKEYARCIGKVHGKSPSKTEMLQALARQRQSKDDFMAMFLKGAVDKAVGKDGKQVGKARARQPKQSTLAEQVRRLRCYKFVLQKNKQCVLKKCVQKKQQ